METPGTVQTVAVAGASGFVGSALRRTLAGKYRWIALTRSEAVAEAQAATGTAEAAAAALANGTEWRRCDLYSLPQVREALRGADLAIYMVHSMLPSSRLVQGNFADMDLLLADNFIRAAEEAGVRRVVYLGGLIPHEEEAARLSSHLASRLEVEHVLRGRSVPVTVLRAGVVFGPGGSSARMLFNLINRLPVMVLPAWTRNTTQSIDVRDVVRAIGMALESDEFTGCFDIAGHPPMTYGEMIRRTAELLGRHPRAVPVPFNAFRFSRLWVRLFSSAPANLVTPLIESLRHSLVARDNPLLERLRKGAVPFERSVRESVDAAGRPLPNPRDTTLPRDRQRLRSDRRVRSVQRAPLPAGWSIEQVMAAYTAWLRRATLGMVRPASGPDGGLILYLLRPRWVLLRFTLTPFSRANPRRRAFYIDGGTLARRVDPPGRFELRMFPEIGCVVAAIHGYAPRLPWPLYACTQAIVHLVVMAGYRRWMARAARGSTPTPARNRS